MRSRLNSNGNAAYPNNGNTAHPCIAAATQRKCTYKRTFRLVDTDVLEFVSPYGSSMAVNVGNTNTTASKDAAVYKRGTGRIIDKDILISIVRECNGMTPVLVLDEDRAFMVSAQNTPRQDVSQIVSGEEYEASDVTELSHLRSIPVVNYKEFQADADECIRLCDIVSSRIANRIIAKLVDARDRFADAHSQLTEYSREYFAHHDNVMANAIQETRNTRDLITSHKLHAGRLDSSKQVLQTHERNIEVIHSHVATFNELCVAMDKFNQAMAAHVASVRDM